MISYLHYFFSHHGLGESERADNCAGQNKNNYFLWYFAWRIMNQLHASIVYSFLIAGHTKFGPDRSFGVIKKVYKVTYVSSPYEFANMVETSSNLGVNKAQLVGTHDGKIIVLVPIEQQKKAKVVSNESVTETSSSPSEEFASIRKQLDEKNEECALLRKTASRSTADQQRCSESQLDREENLFKVSELQQSNLYVSYLSHYTGFDKSILWVYAGFASCQMEERGIIYVCEVLSYIF